jgi:hypothetical protein
MSAKPLKINRVDRKSEDELIVGYSDETTAVYGVDQLRPHSSGVILQTSW